MSDNKLLKQIGEVIDERLDKKLKPVKEQLDTVEMKVEVVNERVNGLTSKVEQSEKKLLKAIEKSQEDTIEVLSELIHSGYNAHEERITNIEHHLNLTSPQK